MRGIAGGLVVGLLVIVASAGLAAAQGPYGGENLPAGVRSAILNGLIINLSTTPTISDRQPTFSGVVDQSGGTITVGVASQAPTTATVSVGAGGEWSYRVPAPLEPGRHDLFINGARVGSFNIAAAPAPPATGSPSAGDDGLGGWLIVGMTVFVLAAAALAIRTLIGRKARASRA